jgi:hypothetical protein
MDKCVTNIQHRHSQYDTATMAGPQQQHSKSAACIAKQSMQQRDCKLAR